MPITPAIIMKMEMTHAKMGRSIKNLAMCRGLRYCAAEAAGAEEAACTFGAAGVAEAACTSEAAAACAGAEAVAAGFCVCGGVHSFGCTFCAPDMAAIMVPSTMTLSPAFKPSVIIQFVPFWPTTFTGRGSILPSGVTTITVSFSPRVTACCGTRNAFKNAGQRQFHAHEHAAHQRLVGGWARRRAP